MEKKKQFYYVLGGFLLGVLTACLVWPCAAQRPDIGDISSEKKYAGTLSDSLQEALDTSTSPSENISADISSGSPAQGPLADIWDSAAVYTGGDTVSYQGRRYRAKWWTQGERPDSSDVWEDLGILNGEAVQPDGVDNVPIDASQPQNTELTDFKVVGYYPGWKPDKLNTVDFGIVTHLCYAFAIPTAEGGLRDLENPQTAESLIRSAHKNGAKDCCRWGAGATTTSL